MALTSAFKQEGLHLYVDYHVIARTYGSGIICLELLLYSDEALRMRVVLDHLAITDDDRHLRIALLQVTAEKQERVRGDAPLIRHLLQELHGQPWQSLDQLHLIDARSYRRSSRGLHRYEASPRSFRLTECSLLLDAAPPGWDRHLAALFHVTATALLDNVVEDLADAFGAFDAELTRFSDLTQKRVLRQPRRALADLAVELDCCSQTVNELLVQGFVRKLAQVLQAAHQSHDLATPDERTVYVATDLLVGGAGWRSLGSEDHIESVLRRSTLRLKRGSESRDLRLSDLMDASRGAVDQAA